MGDRLALAQTATSWQRLVVLCALLVLPYSTAAATPSDSSTFTLRHVFHRGTYRDPDLHKRLDIHPTSDFTIAYEDEQPESASAPKLSISSKSLRIDRLVDRRQARIEEHLEYARLTGFPRILGQSEWTRDDIPGPNVTDKGTVINLAIMAGNAYIPKYREEDWEDVRQGFNVSTGFGWEGDGLRGQIFANENNETIIIGIKGTSKAVFDGDGTTTNDKVNDNLFFSCCCAQGGHVLWRQVCDCQTSVYTCNQTCLVKALKEKTRYYSAAIDLYTNVTNLYPNSNIWITGHSLGGAVSSLLGLTFGLPTVTYEAPADDLAARRLGLPHPIRNDSLTHHPYRREYSGAFHIGHNADPIYMGACHSATSLCTLGGYSFESQCHTGTMCTYDTQGDLGWRMGLGYHGIRGVIANVLRKYNHVPGCEPDIECVDCNNWKFFESNGSDPITTTTTTKTMTTRTRTQTCETPGWWGCLDKTTTSSIPIATTTITTTTCISPGWFGCNKEANTTITTTTKIGTLPKISASLTTSLESTTTTCKTPGLFFGCLDKTTTHNSTTARTASRTSTKTPEPTSAPETSCKTPGLFFGCWDDETTTSPSHTKFTSTNSITSAPTRPTASTSLQPTSTTLPHKKKCKIPVFFGLICLSTTEEAQTLPTATAKSIDWQSEL